MGSGPTVRTCLVSHCLCCWHCVDEQLESRVTLSLTLFKIYESVTHVPMGQAMF